jgi:catechol 2,3-dioxygenase-like lactoylglutathione lyase family enzyme
MSLTISGIHHVTAIAADPQVNVDFYTQVLGLRLVKKTVNFDDPGTYHFYFGDGAGQPGTILTFFPWVNAYPGRTGSGMASDTAFSVPASSLDYWVERLADRGLDFNGPQERLGDAVISFRDPDGLNLEIVSHPVAMDPGSPPWTGGGIPEPRAIRGFHSVTLCLAGYERTAELLTSVFGYVAAGEEGDRFRFRSPQGERASVIDLRCQPDRLTPGRLGSGTVHHVAFRAASEEEQRSWREKIASLGYNVTPVLDRQYFRSIYFREPGGVLFEIATDPPGFLIDEQAEQLGSALKLPPWLEAKREQIERRLPPISLSLSASQNT